MEPLHTEMTLPAPRDLVWATLADLEGVSVWNPSIEEAECISDQVTGLGARRRCRMRPSGWMTETVTEFELGRCIAFTVDKATPLKSGVGRFVLADSGADTSFVATFDYEIRFGPLGPVIDRLVVHRQHRSAWNDGMEGLRRHIDDLAQASA
mgnify:CR=1 FL=1